MAAPCGWCVANDHERCKPEGMGWQCSCALAEHKKQQTAKKKKEVTSD